MKCAYGDGKAKYAAHDKRGCKAVCAIHAFWRRYWCSQIGGCKCDMHTVSHITDLDGCSMNNAFRNFKLPNNWTSISGCGELQSDYNYNLFTVEDTGIWYVTNNGVPVASGKQEAMEAAFRLLTSC